MLLISRPAFLCSRHRPKAGLLCVDQAVKTDHKYEWNSGPENDGLHGCADCTREIRPPKHPPKPRNQSVQFCQPNDDFLVSSPNQTARASLFWQAAAVEAVFCWFSEKDVNHIRYAADELHSTHKSPHSSLFGDSGRWANRRILEEL